MSRKGFCMVLLVVCILAIGLSMGQSAKTVNELEAEVNSLRVRVEQLEEALADLAPLAGKVATLEAKVASIEGDVSAIEDNTVLDLDGYLALIDDPAEDPRGPKALFTGVNVQVVNGLDATATINGLGNLIVGYDESYDLTRVVCSDGQYSSQEDCEASGEIWARNQKTGSHNLITGSAGAYTQYGGLVAGVGNIVNRDYSTVSGGAHNLASGRYSSVSGGQANTASGSWSSVNGGQNNTALAGYSTVSGGGYSTASFLRSVVSGGYRNIASGHWSVVSGGRQNTASGDYSVVSGSENLEAATTSSHVP